MNTDTLNQILADVAAGNLDTHVAYERLKHLGSEDIDYATIDHHRSLRKGFPEVIFGEGKTAGQIIGVMAAMQKQENVILATRTSPDKAAKIQEAFPEADYHEDARMVIWAKKPIKQTGQGSILVISAGTSDIPVAMEAYLTAKAMGNPTETLFDVGVAGIHRLFKHRQKIESASVIIVTAGMEGALPTVVAGMVKNPVIAVPTSIGYGVSLNGMTALFAMLNSCSSNVAVVNIDNGFGAGYMASSINHIQPNHCLNHP